MENNTLGTSLVEVAVALEDQVGDRAVTGRQLAQVVTLICDVVANVSVRIDEMAERIEDTAERLGEVAELVYDPAEVEIACEGEKPIVARIPRRVLDEITKEAERRGIAPAEVMSDALLFYLDDSDPSGGSSEPSTS